MAKSISYTVTIILALLVLGCQAKKAKKKVKARKDYHDIDGMLKKPNSVFGTTFERSGERVPPKPLPKDAEELLKMMDDIDKNMEKLKEIEKQEGVEIEMFDEL